MTDRGYDINVVMRTWLRVGLTDLYSAVSLYDEDLCRQAFTLIHQGYEKISKAILIGNHFSDRQVVYLDDVDKYASKLGHGKFICKIAEHLGTPYRDALENYKIKGLTMSGTAFLCHFEDMFIESRYPRPKSKSLRNQVVFRVSESSSVNILGGTEPRDFIFGSVLPYIHRDLERNFNIDIWAESPNGDISDEDWKVFRDRFQKTVSN
ncbi:MAG: hypothetical protein HZA22_13150 [Nitrospirae bacterium]|nr:hypothetical protein [Nitrospirota bacterium]